MRLCRLFAVILLVLAFGAGPVLAAPLYSSTGAAASAPAAPSTVRSLAVTIAYGLSLGAFGITIRKDTASMAKKFVRNAGQAQGDYKDGVANAGGEWEQRTKEAETSYEQGVQESIADKRFGRGVAGSAGKYQANASTLGSQRYAPGVANAEGAWQRGVEPSIAALKSLNLPPRGPRRSPANMDRANAVARALGAVKTGR